ncbi:hypothetical protein Tco_0487916 [Tanacetum coccineum]
MLIRHTVGVRRSKPRLNDHEPIDPLSFFKWHDRSHRKASWIKWSSVVTPKEKGGLGVASLYALNRGLMLKWLWRFYTYPNSIWARVVKAIHGEDGCVGKELKARARSCWLNIVNEASILKEHGVNFFEFLKPKLGDGDKFSFWDDKWCEVGILKSRFPRIYALILAKKVKCQISIARLLGGGTFLSTAVALMRSGWNG